MSKKSKLIVSIASIAIIALILLGITYSYLNTKITGNSSEYSVRATIEKKLKLEYNDGSGIIEFVGNVMPGDTVGQKTFKVSNTGDRSITYGVYLEDILNELELFEVNNELISDLTYVLVCSSNCNGSSGYFPRENTFLVENTIAAGEEQNYTLEVNYENLKGVDQNVNINKRFKGKVNIHGTEVITLNFATSNGAYATLASPSQKSYLKDNKYKFVGIEAGQNTLTIYDENDEVVATKTFNLVGNNTSSISGITVNFDKSKDVFTITLDNSYNLSSISENRRANPYRSNSNLLAYNIINNSMNNLNGTSYRETPLTTPGANYNTNSEKELSITDDDYTATTGNKSYYFRGAVTDNYTNFANMCWRIVRIEGDGSVKLILEDSSYECNSPSYTGSWLIGNIVQFGVENIDGTLEYVNYDSSDFYKGLADEFEDYQSTLSTKISNKYTNGTINAYLRPGNWCYDNAIVPQYTSITYYDEDEEITDDIENASYYYTHFYYAPYVRTLNNASPSLICSGTKLNNFRTNNSMYVGALTLEEVLFAGSPYPDTVNLQSLPRSFLATYIGNASLKWWLLSPAYVTHGEGFPLNYCVQETYNIQTGVESVLINSENIALNEEYIYARPVVTLKPGIEISDGVGTKESPYVLN